MSLRKNINVGEAQNIRQIAILHSTSKSKQTTSKSKNKSAGLFWLGGFKSDMLGSKANYLNEFGQKNGLEVTRFDYSGHGKSSGEFVNGTISDWLEEAKAVFEQTSGEQIIIGSSMGGWLALLLNKALRKKNENRIKAIILIAPAIDMTKDLMEDRFSDKEIAELNQTGLIEKPSDYDEPYILTKQLIDDGEKHLLFSNVSIITNCPIHILQGGLDKDVPLAHALKLVSYLNMDEVNFTLIPDGGHSLSRAQDLAKLGEVINSFLI